MAVAKRRPPANSEFGQLDLDEFLPRYFAGLPSGGGLKPPIGLLQIPHIDLTRGRETYRAAAAALKESAPPDVIYIFGANHRPSNTGIFHATRRPYVTSAGDLEICSDTTDFFEGAFGSRVFADQGSHDREWTIENALPALMYAFQPFPKFVPIIVSHYERMFLRGGYGFEEADEFIDGVAKTIELHEAVGRKVLVVAAVDGSHYGRQFRRPRVTADIRAHVERTDRGYLDAMLRMNPAAAEASIGDNETGIDAVGALGTAMRVVMRAGLAKRGELLRYVQSYNPEADCLVTHATAAWR